MRPPDPRWSPGTSRRHPATPKGPPVGDTGAVISAMLATSAPRLPEGDGWAFEPKVDGYRCLAVVTAGRVRLQSRSGGDMTTWFPSLIGLAELGADLVVDGEVACSDEAGVARFEWMGGWRGGHGTGAVRLYPFDLLRLDGVDLRDRPWQERTDRLRDLLAVGPPDRCQQVTSSGDGPAMWAATAAIGAEGVVAKRRDSRYHPGRSRSWLKTKHRETAWFAVAGWRPTTPGRPGGLVVAHGDDVVGVAVVALPAVERAGLADLIDRYGRRHPTGTTTLPPGAVYAQVSFMARPGVAVLREAVAHQLKPGAGRPGVAAMVETGP
jgi:ATP-dependent DNA ligase